jgi:cytochrome o ubiquinol oxidase operon protein cyoD
MVHDSPIPDDEVPGAEAGPPRQQIGRYLLGLAMAAALTAVSFWAAGDREIYQPAVPVALTVLAIAQIGIHLVFFLRITTEPDKTNDILAFAFAVLIVTLLLSGSLWIMANLNRDMMPMPLDQLLKMQR